VKRKSSNFKLKTSKAFAMKRIYIPIFCAAIAFSSCSTYKNSQTPDDVYYSSNPKSAAASKSNSTSNNNEYYSTNNDQYVQMRVQDPARWSYFDDYNNDYYGGFASCFTTMSTFMYGSPWFGYGPLYSPFGYWNTYYTWNSMYNPYYGGVVVVNTKVPSSTTYTKVNTFSPGSYTNNLYYNHTSTSPKFNSTRNAYSYSQTIQNNYSMPNGGSSGHMYNRTMNSGFSNNNNYNQPTRTYTPSSFGSGGAHFGGGGGGMRVGGGGLGRPGR